MKSKYNSLTIEALGLHFQQRAFRESANLDLFMNKDYLSTVHPITFSTLYMRYLSICPTPSRNPLIHSFEVQAFDGRLDYLV